MAIRSSTIMIADTLADESLVDVSGPVIACLETGRIRIKNGTWGDSYANDLASKCDDDDTRLSDARTPLAHKASHENNGGDELNVAGLSGVLADPQPPIIGAGGTQAVAGNDSRLTDARTPTGSAGGDLTGAYPNPTIRASVALTTPNLGAATATSLAATAAIKSSGVAGMGYSTGAGGTVTQATNKSTGVTLSKVCGQITMHGAALAAGAIVSFTLTNTTIEATDVLILNHVTTGTRGAYGLNAQCQAGSAIIYVRNNSAASLSEAIVIRFALLKGTIT